MISPKRRSIAILIFCLCMLFGAAPTGHAEDNTDGLFMYIGDSLMKAKAGDLKAVSVNMSQFSKEWNSSKKEGKKAKRVDKHLLEVEKSLKAGGNPAEINTLLSALSGSLAAYDKEQKPDDSSEGKARVKAMLPIADSLKSKVESKDFNAAKSEYQNLMSAWTDAENDVRKISVASYGDIEKYMAFVRIAITQEPADPAKAKENIAELKESINGLLTGNIKKSIKGNYSLTDVSERLEQSKDYIEDGKNKQAISSLNQILNIWPMVEGDVSTRDSKLYSDMETKVPSSISLLQSKKPQTKEAKAIIEDLHDRLNPLLKDTSYSMWDAALILLREGLEALLIVATLLSFLKKVNQGDKQKWIWAGVAAGLAASSVLAVIINILFSRITAASSREYIEGLVGIAAVIMMLTVGAWLHSKSNVNGWNRYINKQMGEAIATGSLFSFAFISFLSIFREGAETIIFYTGMAPYMSLKQLVIGIVIALAILAVIGFIIIHYSVKVPIRLFFMAATLLIYVLSFKVLGISIHSLQVSQLISAHTIHSFPFIEWIGLYPTAETLVPQAVLILIIILAGYWIKKRNQTAL
ncbi:high-affinity iron transporter [Bacillus sp. OV322]|uniref:FTR1 family iron permease n=1 Tax=Bacillus sp. OV322 TaxID=1882764 RepID=UPI0008EE8E91|nr:FTR1 family protein [Bacillus sp. OV322]SFC96744.1 high-affinity iron transporter [Bacillus sp. OV322]